MYPKTMSYAPLTANATGFATGVSGASWALTATVPGDNLAHQVTVTQVSATDHSAKTLVITGTDSDGRAQTETINLPNGAVAVTTTKYFKSIISPLVPSSTIGADTMNIGFAAPSFGPTYIIDFKKNPISIGLAVNITGTINYSLQWTHQNPFTTLAPAWQVAASPFSGATASQNAILTNPALAVRLIVSSVTNGATAAFSVVQGGNV
jgi:hypothetical protein